MKNNDVDSVVAIKNDIKTYSFIDIIKEQPTDWLKSRNKMKRLFLKEEELCSEEKVTALITAYDLGIIEFLQSNFNAFKNELSKLPVEGILSLQEKAERILDEIPSVEKQKDDVDTLISRELKLKVAELKTALKNYRGANEIQNKSNLITDYEMKVGITEYLDVSRNTVLQWINNRNIQQIKIVFYGSLRLPMIQKLKSMNRLNIHCNH